MTATRSTNGPRARLGCELLESRTNPAGNVSVFVTASGQLYVVGDVFDNAVSTQMDAAGNIAKVTSLLPAIDDMDPFNAQFQVTLALLPESVRELGL